MLTFVCELQIKDLEEDKLHLGGQIERHLWRIQELTHTVMKLKSSGGSSMVTYYIPHMQYNVH